MKSVLDVRTEGRYLTILFCDMIDSTLHQFNMDPEQFSALLGAYRKIVFEQVNRHRGHVARVIGDGILAYFGWPRATGRDAEMAVVCALEIGRELARHSKADPNLQYLAARMGIETGWVLVGDIGPLEQIEHNGVVGRAPNIAARLQHLAGRNGVVAGETTLSLLPDWFQTEVADTTGIKLPMPIRAAHIRGMIDKVAPLARLQPSQSSPLIGREAERERLIEAWRIATSGAGQVVLVSGEPGVGKSRLVGAFLESLPLDSYRCLALFCTQQSIEEAFYPLVAPLRRALDLTLDASHDEISAGATKLARWIGHDADAEGVALAALLGVPVPAGIPTAEIRRNTFSMLNSWIADQAANRPLVLVVDDFQWADPSFASFIEQLAAHAGTMRLLLLITHRADHIVEWAEQVGATRHHLGPLPPEEAAKLAGTVLEGISADDAAMIATRADGIPLFVEEFARASRDSGHRPEQLPAAISQLLAARLDSLGPTRHLAQLAAVIGDETSVSMLAQIAGMSDEECLEHADLLLTRGVMTRRILSDGTLVSFRHVLLREAAYQALPTAHRARLHGMVAEHLRNSNLQMEVTAPAVLGWHLERAGRPTEAADLFRRASATELTTGAFAEAEAHARRAVRLLEKLTDNADIKGHYSALSLLGEALIATRGEGSTEVRTTYERAAHLALQARAMNDLPPLVRGLCASYQVRGPLARARKLSDFLLRLSKRIGDDALIADAERRLGWCLVCRGSFTAAGELLEQSVKRASTSGVSTSSSAKIDARVRALANLAILSALRESDEEICERTRRLVTAIEECQRPLAIAYGYGCAAIASMIVGDIHATYDFAAKATQAATEHGLVYWSTMAQILSSWAETRLGSQEHGLASLLQGLALYRKTESLVLLPLALIMLSDAEAESGSLDRAIAALDEGDRIVDSIGAQAFRSLLLVARSKVLYRAGKFSEAQDALELAHREATAIGAVAVVRRTSTVSQLLEGKARQAAYCGASAATALSAARTSLEKPLK